jgi:putative transposase
MDGAEPAQGARRDLSGIRWNRGWINVSAVCIGEYVGLEEIDDGIWEAYFGPLKLGRLHERHMKIENACGRLLRQGA